MDELNVQQCWGITPFIDLLQAASAAGAALPDQQQQGGDQVEQQQLAFMQVRAAWAVQARLSSET
jgi:hypothetical protein